MAGKWARKLWPGRDYWHSSCEFIPSTNSKWEREKRKAAFISGLGRENGLFKAFEAVLNWINFGKTFIKTELHRFIKFCHQIRFTIRTHFIKC